MVPMIPRTVPEPAPEIIRKAQIVRGNPIPPPAIPERSPERIPFSISLKPLFAGIPVGRFASGTGEVLLTDLKTWRQRKVPFSTASETFKVGDLEPGTFSGAISLDADVSNPRDFPGDFTGNFTAFRGPNDDRIIEIPMKKFLHILEPADNATERTGGIRATDSLRVSWEPIAEADMYEVELVPMPAGWPRVTLTGTAPFALFPNLESQKYDLHFRGKKGRETIGVGWYHFVSYLDREKRRFIGRSKGPLPVRILTSSTAPQNVEVKFYHQGREWTAPPKARISARVTQRSPLPEGDFPIETHTDCLVIRGLPPGAYQLQTIIDANPGNPLGFSGDFRGSKGFSVASEAKRIDLILSKVLHMKFPEDNDDPGLFEKIDTGHLAKVKPPVCLEWESAGEGAKYEYFFSPPLLMGVTTSTALLVDLPPGVANFRLRATGRDGGFIGELWIGGSQGRNCYPFLVDSLPENPLPPPNR